MLTFCVKFDEQNSHLNDFSLWIESICFFKLPFFVKLNDQKSHLNFFPHELIQCDFFSIQSFTTNITLYVLSCFFGWISINAQVLYCKNLAFPKDFTHNRTDYWLTFFNIYINVTKIGSNSFDTVYKKYMNSIGSEMSKLRLYSVYGRKLPTLLWYHKWLCNLGSELPYLIMIFWMPLLLIYPQTTFLSAYIILIPWVSTLLW